MEYESTYRINIKNWHVQFFVPLIMPLKLGRFYNFVEFSLFYWLKHSKSKPFDKRNGLEWLLVKSVS